MTEEHYEEIGEMVDNLLNWLQEAEDNNTFTVSTQSVKRHLEKIKKEQLTIPVVSERKIVRCEDPMVCLRGCSVHEQTCEHPIYER